ncbi:MAG: Gx transporter family protein [Faecousia sp.]
MTKTKQLALSAVLVAMALGLSYLERFLPLQLLIPLPGVKLGLANIVTMMALYFLSGKITFSVLVVRCLLGSVFGGGVTALAMSLTGGLFAFAAMALAKKLPFLSVFGVSILGAAAHNLGQVCAAAALLYSGYTFAYLPFLLLLSIPSGLLTGTISAAAFRTLGSVFPTAVTISSHGMK